MANIVLDRVQKRYPNGFVATHNLSLEVGDEEFLVLVGPSGSGKSTVLRMIAGLERVTAGRILIDGRDVTDLPPQARDLAMVFQSYALYPHMTVRQNLAFGLTVRKEAAALIARRVGAVAESLGIGAVLDRRPAQLSGGQRQRVALGRAMVREPVAFLFDEPLSNLDARLRVETRAELAQLHRRLRTTMVYVTHDQIEAMTLGTHVAVMHEGRLQQVAPPMELYRAPANRFVAGFVGSPEMNFVAGHLRRVGDPDDWIFEGRGLSLGLGNANATMPDVLAATNAERGVVVGVRPHALAIVGGRGADTNGTGVTGGTGDTAAMWDATVRLIEPVGSEQVVHLRAGDNVALVVVAPADLRLAMDDAVRVRVPAGAVHLFDVDNGRAIGAAV